MALLFKNSIDLLDDLADCLPKKNDFLFSNKWITHDRFDALNNLAENTVSCVMTSVKVENCPKMLIAGISVSFFLCLRRYVTWRWDVIIVLRASEEMHLTIQPPSIDRIRSSPSFPAFPIPNVNLLSAKCATASKLITDQWSRQQTACDRNDRYPSLRSVCHSTQCN